MENPSKKTTISNNSGNSLSLWMDWPLPSFPILKEDLEADVCIVGAGIAGLTCAYTLAKLGKSVVVCDQGAIAGGQTARTTAHLTWVLDDRYHDLEKLFGEKGTRLAAESHAASIDYIEQIIQEERIDCDFERVHGYLFLPPGDSKEILEKEYAAIKKAGMKIDWASKAPFSDSFDTGPCLRFPGQAQFHVLKYIQGLIKALLKYGGKIYSETSIHHIKEGLAITESGIKISCSSIIVATCSPINDRYYIHTKQASYRTYVIGCAIPKDSVQKGLYWDTLDPYHYIRIQGNLSEPDKDWLLIGGEDHRTGQDPDIEEKYHRLEDWAKIRFPMMHKISYKWSGQVFEPVDSLAFIGRNPGDENIYIATGDSGNGLTHGTIAGILLPDLITRKDNPWQNLYEPSRKTLSAASEYICENINSMIQYRDWLTPGENKAIDALRKEEGIILREGLKKIAVYKDKDNRVHMNSAFCPHLGGCLRWNQGEKSWDCPVHGSRFDGCGKVLNAPANHRLATEKGMSL